MPKLADHRERRQEAVEALWRVLAAEGFAGVSVRSVVAETAWSRGIVDYYFESFSELLRLGLRRLCERDLAEHLDPGVRVGVAALRAMLLAGMPLDEQRRMVGRIWIAYLGATVGDPEIRHEYARCQALRGQAWQAVLAQMVERGELAGERDLEIEATHVMAFELAMNVYGLLNPQLARASVLEQHVDQFIASLIGEMPSRDI
jgi:AcrR family transcriptional regulator